MALDWAPFSTTGTPLSFGLRRVEAFDGQRIVVCEGRGVEGDPVREVVYWLDERDRLIARYDPAGECDTAMGVQDFAASVESEAA